MYNVRARHAAENASPVINPRRVERMRLSASKSSRFIHQTYVAVNGIRGARRVSRAVAERPHQKFSSVNKHASVLIMPTALRKLKQTSCGSAAMAGMHSPRCRKRRRHNITQQRAPRLRRHLSPAECSLRRHLKMRPAFNAASIAAAAPW